VFAYRGPLAAVRSPARSFDVGAGCETHEAHRLVGSTLMLA
jgi:hypothetical protein